MSFDAATFANAFAGPGMDTRQWVSIGLVAADTPENRAVRFVDDDGVAFPEGPLVTVDLQPSGITVVCRVGNGVAGDGEGDWFPFLERDEVLVVLPEGNERAAPVIISRLSNGFDKWPATVAGQDATKNVFGFRRLRTPYIIESASSFMIRSALTGANITIDQTGNLIIASSDAHTLTLNTQFISLATGDGSTFLQIDDDTKELTLQAGDTTQFILAKDSSQFLTTGSFSIGTGGMAGVGHAVTVEQVAVLLQGFLVTLGVISPGPLTGAAVAGAAVAIVNGAITAGSALPVAPLLAAITAALQIPTDPTGALPGVGRAGFMY